MRLKPVGKLILFILVLGVAFGGMKVWQRMGGGSAPGTAGTTTTPPAVKLDPQVVNTPGSGGSFTMPGSEPGCTDLPEVRILGYAWNAQMGLHFANGGAQATTGSLMCKYGVNLKFARQDDNSKLTEALIAFATELSQGNPNPSKGVHFVMIMGDGGAAFLHGLNDNLKRIGPEYTAKVVGSCGYSRGEDKFMGPAEWKSNPVASRGGFVAGVLRDGDWNIAQKWLGDNGLRTNPDEKTYDPDALNWVNASDYIDAAQKYIAGYKETRPVVHNGKLTGESKEIAVNGVVTWTPGDVTIAEQKGGLVSIVSTKEYSSQMPCIIIGIDKWMRENRKTVEGMLRAISEGGDAVKSHEEALKRASAVSAAVYKEKDADYWETYFKGTKKPDKTGVMVELGGSSVNNLADNLLTFGLVPGSRNLFDATYRAFGDLVVAQYPDLVPNYPPTSAILDTSYLQNVAKKAGNTTTQVAKAIPKVDPGKRITKVGSRKSWHITFETGKATFTPDAARELEKLRRDLLIASGMLIEVHGHTDNQGNPAANMALSENRAFAVKNWLENKSKINFPKGRIQVFAHGQQNPLVSNATPQGRAQNRRVDIVLGTTE